MAKNRKGWDHAVPAIVEVHWQDAVCSRGWRDRKERLADTDFRTGQVKSVGYLVKDGKEGVSVTMSLNKVDDMAETLWVPRAYICEMTTLREADPDWKDEH